MTARAREWKRKRALTRFALAVKALPISVAVKSDIIMDAVWAIDYSIVVRLRMDSHSRFGSCGEYSTNRTERRFIYRNLLRACGVDSRRV